LAGKVPSENAAVPMTYRTKSGRQFVVVATGTGAKNGLVGFAISGNWLLLAEALRDGALRVAALSGASVVAGRNRMGPSVAHLKNRAVSD
jgi:hypothetical protein